MIYDAIIVGGSYAGLSAGLQLARARRSVLVIDEGLRRNRFAESSHGFLGHDGRAPGAIAADGRTQLLAYPSVTWLDARAAATRKTATGFEIDAAHDSHVAQRLILATGVGDQLPDVPGLAERWGKSVFHCPYCHGYELRRGRIGVIASSDLSMHHALMLPDWGETTLFLNDAFVPDEGQMAQLRKRGVSLEREPIAKISDHATVELRDGRAIALDGMFTVTRISSKDPLAEQLGCDFDDGPIGPVVKTDAMKETTVPGVFACGDVARMAGNVALAVGDGVMAGVAAHRSLMFADL
jgi:thioredoxin reductase